MIYYGLMKKLLVLVSALFVFASSASAREGLIDLTNSGVSCKGISIFQDSNYKVSGRCDGLVYPYETTYNKYVLWGKTINRGETIRIAEVDRGYFSGYIASAYDSMFITAEKDGLVRRPSDRQVVLGKVSPFSFDKSQVTAPAASTAPAATSTSVQSAASTTTSTAGTVIGKIVTSLLVIILVIVGLVIGASLIFRKRGSVSA
jgi:hypothetical protein